MGNRSTTHNVDIELEDVLSPSPPTSNAANKQTHRIPAWCSPLLLASLVLLYALTLFQFNHLPSAVQTKEETIYHGHFIGERAQDINNRLTALGVRVVGGQSNEVAAIQFLRNEIDRIILASNRKAHNITVDRQEASGSFSLFSMTSVYRGIQNVIVRLSPAAGPPPNASLLVNSHFDSVPVSVGAGDDGTMVAVMLETLQVLSQFEFPHQHSVIFLFNGAEENGLQGSHPFITQHRWAANVTAFINLDSAGSGGRDMLFQATAHSPWLLRYYAAAAPHPFATVLGQEMFEAGLIPSDTDFRIFRDNGHLVGIDIATGKNGFVYHTKYDRAEIIPRETYQNIGENLLGLTRALANAKELSDPRSYKDTDVVYFDYLGWFLVSYTSLEGVILNVGICVLFFIALILSVRSFAHSSNVSICHVSKELAIAIVCQLITIFLAALVLLSLATVYDVADRSLSWFSNPWLIFGIYLCPLIIMLALGPMFFLWSYRKRTESKWNPMSSVNINHSCLVQIYMHSHAIIIAVLVVGLLSIGIKSAFIFSMALAFYTVAVFANVLLKWQSSDRIWLIPHLLSQLLPFLYYSNLTITLVVGFLPMQGRIGPATNPELMIGLMFTVLGLLMGGGFVVPITFMHTKIRWIMTGLFGLYAIAICLMLSPIGFPYRAETSPQRQWIFHTDREFYHFNRTIRLEDSGYFVLGMDRHASRFLPNISQAQSTDSFCDDEMVCGLPFYTPRMFRQARFSHWIPAGRTTFKNRIELKLLATTQPGIQTKRYTFEISGCDHMIVTLSPKPNSRLIKWSFNEILTESGFSWRNRSTYFVFVANGVDKTPYTFWIDISTSDDWSTSSLDLAVTGHFVHHDQEMTEEFRHFLASFPDYVHVTPWMSVYKSWEF